jgi:TRAP-type uncharacterized transport system substrate-binding protein
MKRPPPLEPPGPLLSRRIVRWFIGVPLVALVLGFLVVHFVSPMPPRVLTMSTGVEDGAYYRWGQRYRDALRANGVEVVLKPSSGSVENLARLADGQVSVAFVQSGLGPLATAAEDEAADASPLRSLATVAYEPVWIFTHTVDVSTGLDTLKGHRIAVGVPHSGNLQVALQLLAAYGVDVGGDADAPSRTESDGTTLLDEGGLAAAGKLQRHEIDAMIVIASPEAPVVQKLLADPSMKLGALDHVEGLARRFPYLQPVSLKRGSVDLARDLPRHDIPLLAARTNLVVRQDLHAALAYLLLQAAKEVHQRAGLVNPAGEFPSARNTDFDLSDAADRYFKNGRPFLQNWLPFWAANYVQRLLLVLLPIAALLFPLLRLVPELITWRRQARLYRRYGELRVLEQEIASRTLDDTERQAASARLDHIEREIFMSRFPLEFSDRVYTLRQHVDYVRSHLARPGGPPP